MPRKIKTPLERFNAKAPAERTADGCWIWLGSLDRGGYGRVRAGGRGSSRVPAHRLAYELFKGPIPEWLVVMHSCDTPSCVNPDHLSVGTQADNIADMVKKGRGARGEGHGRSKLTVEEVIEIRKALAEGSTQQTLAERYSVSQSTISDISSETRWAHAL